MDQITSKELKLLSHNFQVRFALFCAYQVEDKWINTPEAVEATRITELWLDGKASNEECKVTAKAAAHAANAAYAATYAAANAAYAAAYAANAAANAVYATNAANAVYAAASATNAANAVYAAAYAASNAAYAAAYAVKDRSRIIKDQWDYYNRLLSFHEEFERVVLNY